MTQPTPSPKIAVVGNCQARPLRTFLGDMLQQEMPIEPIVVHLATEEQRDEHLALLDRVDIILAQPVASNYPVRHVQTDFLRERYSDRLVIWPNLFFHGQTPSLFYVAGSISPGSPPVRLRSALDVYHDEYILGCWLEHIDASECVAKYQESGSNATNRFALSLEQFRERETQCDVQMSDFVSERFQTERLFFTFNHPTSVVLCELAKRIGLFLSLPIEPGLARQGEFLGRVVPPVSNAIRDELGLVYADLPLVGVVSSGTGERRYEMDLAGIVRASYEAYDSQLASNDPKDLRFTPVRI